MPQRQQLLPPRTVSHTTTITTPRQLNFMRSWQLCFLVGGRKLTHPYKATQTHTAHLTSLYFTLLNAIIPHHTTPHLTTASAWPPLLARKTLRSPLHTHTHIYIQQRAVWRQRSVSACLCFRLALTYRTPPPAAICLSLSLACPVSHHY